MINKILLYKTPLIYSTFVICISSISINHKTVSCLSPITSMFISVMFLLIVMKTLMIQTLTAF